MDPQGLPAEIKAVSGPEPLHAMALEWAKALRFRPALLKTSAHPEGVPQFGRVRVSLTWNSSGGSYQLLR